MRKIALPLILLVYAALGVAMSLIVPLGEAPDEIDHFLYVRYLLENDTFPVMHPVAADNETMEANQPPLFYLLNAAVTAPFPMTAPADFPLNACYTFDPHDGGRPHFYLHQPAEQIVLSADYLAFRVARLVSLLLGGLTVWLAYRLGRQMVPGDERVGLLAAAFLALNPQFIFITASVNNDVLTAVLGAALVYESVQAVNRPGIRPFIVLGLLMGLALLTKFALLAFWPLPVVAALLVGWQGQRKVAVQGGLLVVGLPLLLAGWWYLRAARQYGDPLAWDVHLQAKGSEVLRTDSLALVDLREFVMIHFQSYWAWFGWLKIQAADWVYGMLAFFVLLAVAGVILAIRSRPVTHLQALIAHPSYPFTAVLFNLLAVAAIYASLLRYIQTINWSGYQGRLAYAAAAPIATLLALGWYWLGKKVSSSVWVQRGMVVLPVCGLLALALASLVQLHEAFKRPDVFLPPVAWERVCRETPDGFYVEAVEFAGRALPGEPLVVSLGGYGLMAGQTTGELVLLGWDGALLDGGDIQFSYTASELVMNTVQLRVPLDSLPMRARLLFITVGAAVELGEVKIVPTATVEPSPINSINANFAGQIELVGYDLQQEPGRIRLTTYWRPLQSVADDLTIFVHLLNEAGELVAQQDAQPQGGRYPTSIWDVGEVVVDERIIESDAAETAVLLAVGLYVPESGQRVPFTVEGQPPGDALRLPLLQESIP